MVKREPMQMVVGSAVVKPGIGKGKGDWRYKDGIVQRAASLVINGKEYCDPKELPEKLPRRKIESNFFITLNTNRTVSAEDTHLRAIGEEIMEETMQQLSKDACINQYLKYGPMDNAFKEDRYGDIVSSVEWNHGIEYGPTLQRLHVHIWLTIHHYSQLQINMPQMQHAFKLIYNQEVDKKFLGQQKLIKQFRMGARPYIQVKLLPCSEWAEVIKRYMQKAMVGNS